MNLIDLINRTATDHTEFRAAVECNLDQQLQQYVLRNQADSEYDACTKVLELMLNDSIGSLVETWLGRDTS